jgi:aryl-alcohol dehydrogenase-like predicted oxidoreductase
MGRCRVVEQLMISQKLPNVILGTAQLSSPYGVTNLSGEQKSPEEAHFYLREAKRLGISVLDTAPAYGSAESLIGTSKLQFKIHTKLEKDIDPVFSLQSSLARMGTESIDLLYVHDIEAFRLQPETVSDSLSNLLGVHVKNIGVSLYDIEDLELVLKFPSITHVQLPMNLLDQRFGGKVLRNIQSSGVKCIVRSVFLQGVLLIDPEKLPGRVGHLYPFLKSLRHELTSRDISPLEGCLALVCNNTAIDGVILGAQNEDELRLVMGAWERVRTTPPDLAWLSEIHSPTPSAVDPRLW